MKGPSVAIIGSGPSGFYTTESITKKINSDIDIIDRLPTPFGLKEEGSRQIIKLQRRFQQLIQKLLKKIM